jgi:hypothetical protein
VSDNLNQSNLNALLTQLEKGVVMSNAFESVGELAEQMTAKGWTTKTISLNGSEAINSLAQAWEFPSYFGNNWDAVVDCWSDMSWHSNSRFLTIFEGTCNDQDILIQVAQIVQQRMTEQGKHFSALFVTN